MHLVIQSWGCPGLFFLGLPVILLCPKQSGFKSPRISELPMIPQFGQDLISQMVTLEPAWPFLEYGTLGLDCRVPGPLPLVSGRQHGGLVSMLTMLSGWIRSIAMTSRRTVF